LQCPTTKPSITSLDGKHVAFPATGKGGNFVAAAVSADTGDDESEIQVPATFDLPNPYIKTGIGQSLYRFS